MTCSFESSIHPITVVSFSINVYFHYPSVLLTVNHHNLQIQINLSIFKHMLHLNYSYNVNFLHEDLIEEIYILKSTPRLLNGVRNLDIKNPNTDHL